MGVYKDEGMVDMFFRITVNNIRVSMLAFVMGLTASLGTIVVLIHNGIMLGTFQYFFYQEGLLMTSFLTIWIHGTIEISSIIIAGAAGIVLGNSILFPKTHSRLVSLQMGAYRALRILLGTVPLFVAAGLLESFVTRHTEWPTAIKAGIIILSAILILFMWVIYPWRYSKGRYVRQPLTLDINPTVAQELNHRSINRLSTVTTQTMVLLRAHFGWLMVYGLLPAWSLILAGSWMYYKFMFDDYTVSTSLMYYEYGGWESFVLYSVAIAYVVAISTIRIEQFHESKASILGFFKFNGIRVLLSVSLLWAAFYFLPDWWWLLVVAVIPIHFFLSWASDISHQKKSVFAKFGYYFSHSYNAWGHYIIILLVLGLLSFVLSALLYSTLSDFLTEFISWHDFGLADGYSSYWLINGISALLPLLLFMAGTYISVFLYYSVENRHYAADLNRRLENFGLSE